MGTGVPHLGQNQGNEVAKGIVVRHNTSSKKTTLLMKQMNRTIYDLSISPFYFTNNGPATLLVHNGVAQLSVMFEKTAVGGALDVFAVKALLQNLFEKAPLLVSQNLDFNLASVAQIFK